jgi:hypothetical protein
MLSMLCHGGRELAEDEQKVLLRTDCECRSSTNSPTWEQGAALIVIGMPRWRAVELPLRNGC